MFGSFVIASSCLCESVDKADLLALEPTDSRESVHLPLTCHPSLSLITFASGRVRLGLLNLEAYGGSDPLCMFLLFLKRTAHVLPPVSVSAVFRRLVRISSFSAFWSEANASPIPKVSQSSSVPITDRFPYQYCLRRLRVWGSLRLGRFMERSRVLHTTQLAYRKGLVTCDALMCESHTLQSALECGQQVRIVHNDFNTAFANSL